MISFHFYDTIFFLRIMPFCIRIKIPHVYSMKYNHWTHWTNIKHSLPTWSGISDVGYLCELCGYALPRWLIQWKGTTKQNHFNLEFFFIFPVTHSNYKIVRRRYYGFINHIMMASSTFFFSICYRIWIFRSVEIMAHKRDHVMLYMAFFRHYFNVLFNIGIEIIYSVDWKWH